MPKYMQTQTVSEELLFKTLLYDKSAHKMLVKLDTLSQFHQHFTTSFCFDFLSVKNYKDKL